MIRKALFAVTVVAVLVIGALPAGAHVTVDPAEAPAGGYTNLTFSVGHGCEGSPTTAIAIAIPDGIDSATPAVNPGWTISTETEPLGDAEASEDSHGAERTTLVTWTADTPLPDHHMTTFTLSVRTPDTEGETLYFQTTQTCEEGATRWFDEDPESDTPAPSVTLTASTGGHGGGDSGDDNGGDDAPTVTPVDTSDLATTSDVDSARTIGIIGIVVGAIGIVLAAIALFRRPRSA